MTLVKVHHKRIRWFRNAKSEVTKTNMCYGKFNYVFDCVEVSFMSVIMIILNTVVMFHQAPRRIPENKPKASWPDSGHVTFTDYCARYREGQDLVLKGLTADIAAGEKVWLSLYIQIDNGSDRLVDIPNFLRSKCIFIKIVYSIRSSHQFMKILKAN